MAVAEAAVWANEGFQVVVGFIGCVSSGLKLIILARTARIKYRAQRKLLSAVLPKRNTEKMITPQTLD